MLYKLLTPHAKDCPCAAEKPHAARDWYFPRLEDSVVWRDKAGTKRHASQRWLRFICSEKGRDNNCPAVMLVNLEELERAVSATVRKEKGKR